jgi:NAD(P)H-hydrate epimerase
MDVSMRNELLFPYPEYAVPALTTEQMIEVDRAMIEDYGIELIQMMENAGRNLAHLARRRFLDDNPRGKLVVVLAGSGGNGGGALVAARRLHNYGADVAVFLARSAAEFAPVPAHQLDILSRMGVRVFQAGDIDKAVAPALILDGIIGYSLRGAPRGAAATLIQWANDQNAPILALDAPSGLDTSTGTPYGPTIRAAATMTLALPKVGLLPDKVRPFVGELYLADISVPAALYANPALQLSVSPIFTADDIVRLQ